MDLNYVIMDDFYSVLLLFTSTWEKDKAPISGFCLLVCYTLFCFFLGGALLFIIQYFLSI